jgi:hypothetical protein
MTRLVGALCALVVAATVLSLAAYGAERLAPIIQAHLGSAWFVPACNLFVVFCLMIACWKRRRSKLEEPVPLTPLARRLLSGSREF